MSKQRTNTHISFLIPYFNNFQCPVSHKVVVMKTHFIRAHLIKMPECLQYNDLRHLQRLCNRWRLSISPSICLLASLFVCCGQPSSKTFWWIFFKFSHIFHICLSKSWLNFGDLSLTVAYFNATLKFMGPLARRRSTLSLLFHILLVVVVRAFLEAV